MRVRPRPPALFLRVLTLVYLLSGGVLVAAGASNARAAGSAALGVAVTGTSLVLAWLIAVRVPANPIPPALASITALAAATRAVEQWADSADSADPWPGSDLVAPLVQAIWPLQLVGYCLLLLAFPAASLRRRFALRVMSLGGLGIVLVLVGNWGTSAGDDFAGWRVAGGGGWIG